MTTGDPQPVLTHNMDVITPFGSGIVEGRSVCTSDTARVFVRIPTQNLPPEMRSKLGHLTCMVIEFDAAELVPVTRDAKVRHK